MMNPCVFPDDVAVGGDNLPPSFRRRDALLFKVTIDESGVIAVGNEANFLASRLGGVRNPELAGQFPYLGLLHPAERKPRASQLILVETAEEKGVVLGAVKAARQL